MIKNRTIPIVILLNTLQKWNKNIVETLSSGLRSQFYNSHPKQCSKISVLDEKLIAKNDLKIFTRFLS